MKRILPTSRNPTKWTTGGDPVREFPPESGYIDGPAGISNFANKDPKTNFDNRMIPQKHVLSSKWNVFFQMANLKAMSSSATLREN